MYEIKKEFKENWCKNINYLPFDFCIIELNIIIELDGNQHFFDIPHWLSDCENVRENDIFKMKCALKNNYTVIRIYQPDVWKDTYNWQTDLSERIKPYENPKTIYLAKNTQIYDKHKECFDSIIF